MEFFCPYCKLWMTDNIHAQHYHNGLEDHDDPDERRDSRVRVNGVVYEDEETYRSIEGR